MKTVSPIWLLAFLILQVASSNAGVQRHKSCAPQQMLEKPVFDAPVFEKQKRSDYGLEKPVFEQPQFVREKMTRPLFERPLIERPVFQKECFESLSHKKPKKDEAEKNVVRFPTESGREWGLIQGGNPRRRIIPHHDLRLRKTTIR